MKSLSTIKSELQQIAVNNNLSGKAIDIQIELLAYTLYNSQAEILSAAREVGLNSSKLINSKIERCLDVMYSVYRGRNARLLLIIPSIIPLQIHYNTFDPLYASNNLYLYAAKPFELNSSNNIQINSSNYIQLPNHPSIGNGGVWVVEGILTDNPMTEVTIQPNTSVITHYINLIDSNGEHMNNLSEDISVSLNNIITNKPITRNFIDHLNTSDTDVNDEILACMTIQDYGARLYRKFGFNAGEDWIIRVLKYSTTEFDLDRINKIKIPLTNDLSSINGVNSYTVWDLINPSNPDKEDNLINYIQDELGYDLHNAIYKDDLLMYNTSTCTVFDNSILVPSTKRDDSNSLLYYANENVRVGAYIRSNYDVTHLFYEYFINQVSEADYILNNVNNSGNWMLCNFYIPRPGQTITTYEFNNYLTNRSSYLVGFNDITNTSNIVMTRLKAVNRVLNLELITYNNGDIDLTSQIDEIVNKWQNILGKEIRLDEISSEISKLSDIKFVDKFELLSWEDQVDGNINQDLFNILPNSETSWRKLMQLDYGNYNQVYTLNQQVLTLDEICAGNKCRYFTLNIIKTQLNYYGLTS